MSTHERHGTAGRRWRILRSRIGRVRLGTAALLSVALLAPIGCGEDEAEEDADAAAATDTSAEAMPEGLSGPMAGMDSQTRQEMQQFRRVAQRLNQLQQQALQDPALQEQQAALQERVQTAVLEIDPEAERKVERLEEIQGQLQAASAEGGVGQAQMDSLRPLLTEAQSLQRQVQGARNQAMQREPVQDALEEFRADLLAEMQTLDPRADSLVAVAESLSARLQAARGGPPAAAEGDSAPAPPLEP